MININVSNLCYYFYLNCCVDNYKYTVQSLLVLCVLQIMEQLL
jgi:hypothetical protein